MKRCSICRAWRRRKHYHRRSVASDGLRPECKDCKAAVDAAYYRAGLAQVETREVREAVSAGEREQDLYGAVVGP